MGYPCYECRSGIGARGDPGAGVAPGEVCGVQKKSTDTREKLLAAARECFARKGFNSTTVEDIVESAGVARGTFYIYFANKEAIFKDIYELMQRELFAQVSSPHSGRIYKKIASANRGYLEKYQQFKDVYKVLTEVCNQNPDFFAEVKRLRYNFIEKIVNNIAKGVEKGIYRKIDNPLLYAYALGGMVENFANIWFVNGEPTGQKPFEMDEVVKCLSDIWYTALVPDGNDWRE